MVAFIATAAGCACQAKELTYAKRLLWTQPAGSQLHAVGESELGLSFIVSVPEKDEYELRIVREGDSRGVLVNRSTGGLTVLPWADGRRVLVESRASKNDPNATVLRLLSFTGETRDVLACTAPPGLGLGWNHATGESLIVVSRGADCSLPCDGASIITLGSPDSIACIPLRFGIRVSSHPTTATLYWRDGEFLNWRANGREAASLGLPSSAAVEPIPTLSTEAFRITTEGQSYSLTLSPDGGLGPALPLTPYPSQWTVGRGNTVRVVNPTADGLDYVEFSIDGGAFSGAGRQHLNISPEQFILSQQKGEPVLVWAEAGEGEFRGFGQRLLPQ